MSTFRLFSKSAGASEKRLATCVGLKTGEFLQVFPVKERFESLDAWITSWETHDVFLEEEAPRQRTALDVRRNNRIEREMMEFLDPAFLTNVSRARVIARDKVEVVGLDGALYEVQRSTDFLMEPPTILKNGVPMYACKNQWSPAFTSSKWFLMLACQTATD